MSIATHEVRDDAVIDARIGVLLRSGMLSAGFVTCIGGVLLLFRDGNATADFHTVSGEPDRLRSLPLILLAAFGGDPLAIIQMGMILLIATPIARVVFSVIAFALQKDWLYLFISGVVLAVLIYSLAGHVR